MHVLILILLHTTPQNANTLQHTSGRLLSQSLLLNLIRVLLYPQSVLLTLHTSVSDQKLGLSSPLLLYLSIIVYL